MGCLFIWFLAKFKCSDTVYLNTLFDCKYSLRRFRLITLVCDCFSATLLASFWRTVHRSVECFNDVVFLNAVLSPSNVFSLFLLAFHCFGLCMLVLKAMFPKYFTPENIYWIKLVLIEAEGKFLIEDAQQKMFTPVPLLYIVFSQGNSWHVTEQASGKSLNVYSFCGHLSVWFRSDSVRTELKTCDIGPMETLK